MAMPFCLSASKPEDHSNGIKQIESKHKKKPPSNIRQASHHITTDIRAVRCPDQESPSAHDLRPISDLNSGIGDVGVLELGDLKRSGLLATLNRYLVLAVFHDGL